MDTKTKRIMPLQFVSFVIGREVFAMDVMKVQGVERMMEVTTIPGMPQFMEGVINLRESIIPVVDMRKRFGLPQKEYDKETRIIIIELDSPDNSNGQMVVGVIVDQVNEVFQLESRDMGRVPEIGGLGGKIRRNFIRGVAKKDDRLVIVLDVQQIFSEEEEKAMQSV